MKPQHVALLVIGGMVLAAGGTITAVLMDPSGPSVAAEQPAVVPGPSAAEPEPDNTGPQPPPVGIEPAPPQDTTPPASAVVTSSDEPARPNLGYTLVVAVSVFVSDGDWAHVAGTNDGNTFQSDFKSLVFAGENLELTASIMGYVDSRAVAFVGCELKIRAAATINQTRRALRAVAETISQFSNWESGELFEWVGGVLEVASAELAAQQDKVNSSSPAVLVCKGNQRARLISVMGGDYIGVVVGVEAISPEEATTCPQWQPTAPKETNTPLSGQVQTKTVERSDEYHKVSYILTITNHTADPLAGIAMVQWLDAEGFVLVEELVVKPSIAPGESIFRGSVLIDTPLALKVARTVAEVTAL